MIFYYRYGRGLLRALSFDGEMVTLQSGDETGSVVVTKDESGDLYFYWQGEMIFLDDWSKVILNRSAEDTLAILSGENQPLDKILYLFVASNGIEDSIYELRELDHEQIVCRTYTVDAVYNKDKTGMYKLHLSERGGSGKNDKELYSGAFKAMLKHNEIKRTY